MNLWVAYHHPPSSRTSTATTPPTRPPAPALIRQDPLLLAGLPLPPALEVSQAVFVVAGLLLHPLQRPADPLDVAACFINQLPGGLLLRRIRIPPSERIGAAGG